MSLYTDGLHVTLPTAWPVPGEVDPSLTKLYDIAMKGGPPINLADYTSPEDELEPPTPQVQRAPTEMGDNHLLKETKQQHVMAPYRQKEDTIPTKRLLAVRDWR